MKYLYNIAYVPIRDGRVLRLAVVDSDPQRFGFESKEDASDSFDEEGIVLDVRKDVDELALLVDLGIVPKLDTTD